MSVGTEKLERGHRRLVGEEALMWGGGNRAQVEETLGKAKVM